MKAIRFIAMILMVVGALNWGLVGFFQINLIAMLLGGEGSMIARLVFALVGLAGLYGLSCLCHCCQCKCGPKCHCCKKK